MPAASHDTLKPEPTQVWQPLLGNMLSPVLEKMPLVQPRAILLGPEESAVGWTFPLPLRVLAVPSEGPEVRARDFVHLSAPERKCSLTPKKHLEKEQPAVPSALSE